MAKTPTKTVSTTTPNTNRARGSGSFRDFERDNKLKREDNLKIPLNMILKRPGFNPRDLTKPETVTKIDAIKEAYKNGEYVPAIEVMLAPANKVTIVNGECRFTAATLADAELKAEGKPGIPHLVCVPFKGTDEDQLMLTVTSNAGEKLTVLELSEVVRRAIDDLKMKKPAIAKRLVWSPSYIDKLEAICRLPQAVKDMIYHEKVSVDVALDKVKKLGADAAIPTLQALIDKAEAKGKKVTTAVAKGLDAETETDGDADDPAPAPDAPKTKKPNAKKILTAATALAYALPEVEQDVESIKDTKTYTIKVTGAALKAIIDLQSQFPDEIEVDGDGEDADAETQDEAKGGGGWPFPAHNVQAAA